MGFVEWIIAAEKRGRCGWFDSIDDSEEVWVGGTGLLRVVDDGLVAASGIDIVL